MLRVMSVHVQEFRHEDRSTWPDEGQLVVVWLGGADCEFPKIARFELDSPGVEYVWMAEEGFYTISNGDVWTDVPVPHAALTKRGKKK